MSGLLDIIRVLEKKQSSDRGLWIQNYLTARGIHFSLQEYDSGINILVFPSSVNPFIAVSSHYDVVPNSPGANDNASAIAVCLDLLVRSQHTNQLKKPVAFFFFDEEENGLRGSKAFVNQYSLSGIQALINLEMVGAGNQFALWSLHKDYEAKVLRTFEQAATYKAIQTTRFDQIVTNSADHISFRKAGLQDSFTITCISDEDLQTADHYAKALEFDVDRETLKEILYQAPFFRHYHQPTDRSEHLSESSLRMTADTIWETLLAV